MGRKAIGKPLTLKPIRVDEDVWARLQRLMREFETLNEGLRSALGITMTPEIRKRIAAQVRPRKQSKRAKAIQELAASDLTAQAVGREDIEYGSHEETPRGQHVATIGRKMKAPLLKPSEKKK